jgi:hypothetical protein
MNENAYKYIGLAYKTNLIVKPNIRTLKNEYEYSKKFFFLVITFKFQLRSKIKPLPVLDQVFTCLYDACKRLWPINCEKCFGSS